MRKVHVRDGRLWKLGLFYTAVSLLLFMASMWSIALVNVSLGLTFLALASRLRAAEVQCGGKVFLIVPDYPSSTAIVKGRDGEVIGRVFLPHFGEAELETPCGRLKVEVIPRRFGKVELRIKSGEAELILP